MKTQVNEKRGDVEAKFRPEGMNGNGVAGGKAQLNGNGHGTGSGIGFQSYGKKNLLTTMFISDDASMLFGILVLKPKCPGDSESEQGGTSLISSLLLFLCGLAVVAAGLFK